MASAEGLDRGTNIGQRSAVAATMRLFTQLLRRKVWITGDLARYEKSPDFPS